MKQVSEKRQDLLLDALSCIDEDILEKGLSLRDSAKPAADAMTPPQKDENGGTASPYLYDLSAHPAKPPRRNPWRITAVIAAACLLFCVVPLSVWMAARHGVNLLPEKSDSMDTPASLPNETCADTAVKEEAVGGLLPEGEDNAPNEDQPAPDTPQEPGEAETNDRESPLETEEIAPEEPTADMSEAETVEADGTTDVIVSEEMVWTVERNLRDELCYTGTDGSSYVILNGSVATEGDQQQAVNAEDQLVLKLVGQWFYSVCGLHYGQHFPLFPDEVIRDRILSAFHEAGMTYAQGIEKITATVYDTAHFPAVNLTLTLTGNEELTGSNREEFLRQFALSHPDTVDVEQITSVRKVQLAEGVAVKLDGRFAFQSKDLPIGFYCYEYKGRWYLDDQEYLEDDLCIDLLEADSSENGFCRIKTTEGKVVAKDDTYLYLDTGDAFRIDGTHFGIQTDNGDMLKTQYTRVCVGHTVRVSHYSLTVEGLTYTMDGVTNDVWALSTAKQVDIVG